jgi:23S rRNA (adenine2030-N6)-methyltransferase
MSDYDHRYHVGNHGDVWKHLAVLAVLAAFKHERVRILDTHGGRGRYRLAGTGEWTAGIGRLREQVPDGTSSGSGAVDRYLARIAKTPGVYPGSPVLTAGAMGRNDRLVVYERDPEAVRDLREALAGDHRTKVVEGDGWAAPELDGEPGLVWIDPPYVETEDWARVVEAVRRARRAGHRILVWYPIKRLSRPNVLLAALREAGVPYVALELGVTPLELEKRTLCGSGVVLVDLPRSVAIEVQGAAPVVGEALATHDGRWTVRAVAHRP